MTGQWETRLRNIATGGSDFDVPAASELHSTLVALAPVLQKAAADPGITGESGLAATAGFDAVAKHATTVSRVAKQIQDAAEKANAVRTQAARDLGSLPGGSLSSGDETLVRAAATGATIMLPGFSVIAGDGAVGAINWFLGNQRESHAQTAVRNASDAFDGIAIPMLQTGQDGWGTPVTESPAPGSGSGGPGPSYRSYPGWNDDPLTTHAVPTGLSVGTGLPPIPRPGEGHTDTGSSSNSLHPVVVPPGATLNVDGPTASGSTMLGPSGSSILGPDSGSGGLLGNPSSALIAGGGSAALLGGGRMVAAGGRMAAAGGFGGARGMGGAGIGGSPGVGGAAGATGMGTSTGGSPGSAAARGGGLLGRTEVGGSANGNGVASPGARAGAASGAMGAGSRSGGQGSRTRNRGRGLGGPIAPQLEEDAEFGPRSESAGAGGRDEMSE